MIIILIWVDNIILATTSVDSMNSIKETLSNKFKVKDLGAVSQFLGINIVQKDGIIEMDQSNYIHKILEKFDMLNAKPCSTPM